MHKIWSTLWKTAGWLWHHAAAYFLHYLAILTVAFSVTYFKSIRDTERISYYFHNAIEWVTPITIAFLAVVAAYLLYYTVKQRGQIKQLQYTESTLAALGVRAFSQHDTYEVKSADWALIVRDIEEASANLSPIWLLGSTGKQTFSESDAPLHQALLNYRGPIRILLVRPDSPGFEHRVLQLKTHKGIYLEEILDSITFCKELLRLGKDIQLKLYESMPIWKMLMTPQVLWLQHYKRTNHVDDTPAYGFALGENRPAILDGFECVFEKRWSHDHSKSVDLKAFDRDRWRITC